MGNLLDELMGMKQFLSLTLYKKLSFALRISLVNMTKSTVSCEFAHIH